MTNGQVERDDSPLPDVELDLFNGFLIKVVLIRLVWVLDGNSLFGT